MSTEETKEVKIPQELIEEADSKFDALPGSYDKEKVQELKNAFIAEKLGKNPPVSSSNAVEEDPQDVPGDGDGKDPGKPAGPDDEKQAASSVKGGGGEEPWFAPKKIEYSNVEDVIKDFNTRGNLDINDINDFQKVLEQHNTIKKENESLKQERDSLKDYEKVWETLPDDLFELNNLALRGEDYRKKMRGFVSGRMDYSKSFSDYTTEQVLEAFYPGKFSKQDLEDAKDKDNAIGRAVSIALDEAKSKFDSEKSQFQKSNTGYRDKYNKLISEQAEAYKRSVSSAVSAFESNPSFAEYPVEKKKEIVSLIENGPEAISELFFDTEGKLKKDAPEWLFYALNGKDALEWARQHYSKIGASKATEEILTRDADKPPTTHGGRTAVNPEVEEVEQRKKRVLPNIGKKGNPFK